MAAKRGKLSLGRVLDIVSKGREAAEMVGGTVRVDVRVDSLCPRWIALAVRDDLDQHQSGGVVDVRRLGAHPRDEVPADAALVLAGGSDRLVGEVARSYAARGIPVAVVAESSLDVPELDLPEEQARLCDVVSASEREGLDEGLAEWLVGATDKHVSMAANFPFCRQAEAERLERRCALENAAVGAVDLIHGADLPIMCGNQLKLYFDLSASRGKGLGPQRVAGSAVVVGLAFAWREVGRSLVRHTPAGKFAVRAAMGYAGTVATSRLMGLALDAEDGIAALGAGGPQAWAVALGDAVSGLRERVAGAARPKGDDPAAPLSVPAPKEDPADGEYLTYGDGGLVL